jgi:hypothetical protein
VERLLELELKWMETLVSSSSHGFQLLRVCCKHLPLEYPTQEGLRKFIEKQYQRTKLPDHHIVSDFIEKQGRIIKGFLN